MPLRLIDFKLPASSASLRKILPMLWLCGARSIAFICIVLESSRGAAALVGKGTGVSLDLVKTEPGIGIRMPLMLQRQDHKTRDVH
ncbi:hypothetical protein G6F65_022602 [Rhizopus arrhizus]|jgi:hypothetical protein|nr:hypothetical protein G6F65_022602 [Rhizopus arrhizus]